MEKIIKEINELWEPQEIALKCGGTHSSMNLKKGLSLIIEIDEFKNHPDYGKALAHLNQIIEVWRNALIKHNSNKNKFIEYDIKTGLRVQ
ncbi:MAG: hypothetical protein OCD01_18870 [Fibrobacterales bacterium]